MTGLARPDSPPEWTATILSLVDLPLPEDLGSRLEDRGFRISPISLGAGDALPKIGEPPGTLFCVWVGDDWECGLRFLKDSTRRARRTALLVGTASPPRPVDQQVRALGTLGGIAWPADDVWFDALGRALERADYKQSFRFLDELRTLAAPVENGPFLLFQQIARIARTLLASDLTLITLQDPENGGLLLLDSGESGPQPVEWPTRSDLPHARIAQEALEDESILVIPVLKESEAGSGVHSYNSAISLPIDIRGPDPENPVSDASTAVSLYWEEPFLPTAVEYLCLEVLAALGRAALHSSANHRRQAKAHMATTTAFDQLHQATAVPGPEDIWDEHHDRAQVEFAQKLLQAYAVSPYLEDLWVRISPHSRDQPPWVSINTEIGETEPPVEVPAHFLECGGTQVETIVFEDRWALLVPVRDKELCFGVLVAIFHNRAVITLAREEVHHLARDLALGICFFRRAANNAAVIELTKILSNAAPPEETLLQMARVVMKAMAADGCKMLVVRGTPDGPGVQQICRTDKEKPQKDPLPLELERGLGDWVLLHGDWLLIDRPSERTGVDPEVGFTSNGRKVERLARSENEFDIRNQQADSEGTILLVPLYRQGRRAGVLAVWRETKYPFEKDLDTESLQHFAPHIASACGQVLQVEKLQQQLDTVSALTRDLARSSNLPECYGAVLGHIGELARVPHALLLLSDDKGHFFTVAAWSTAGQPKLPQNLQDFQLRCQEPRVDWSLEIEIALGEKLKEDGLEGLQCQRIFKLHDKESPRPTSLVALFDRTNSYADIGIFGKDFQEQAVRSFLRYSGSLLEKHIPNFKHKVIDEFFSEIKKDRPHQILELATELVLQATGADGALAYGGDYKSREVTATVPEKKSLLGLRVLPGSLTQQAINEKRIVYAVDINAEEHPRDRQQNLERIRDEFGWSALRSWLSCPVVHEGRYFGLIKILTSDSGVYLGGDDAEIVEAIAHRAAWEIHKINRHVVLQELNKMADELADTSGTDLGQALLDFLESFATRFVKTGCKIAIVSRTEGDVLIETASSSLPVGITERLPGLSKRWDKEEVPWQGKKRLPYPSEKALPLPGVAVPLQLSGQPLSGHLFFFHSVPFSNNEVAVIREAARESAIVLNGERLREAWVTLVGMFRHALLGPVQGLASSARELAELAEEAGLDPETLREPRGILEAEVESIRLWRENQRLYMKKEPELVPRPESLVKLLEACVGRFRGAMAERRITLKKNWPEKGSLDFRFDRDALDLAISNLLDNARKYSFANRIVTLGARVEGDHIKVWVEDEGLPIPEHLEQQIYEFGKRLDFRDPVRAIHGEGLGLPMAVRIIEAHGGRLYHSCDVLHQQGKKIHQPYSVCFTIEIPHHWR